MKIDDFKTFVPKELVQDPKTTGMDIMTYNILLMYGNNYFSKPIYITPIFVAGHIGNMKKAADSLEYLSSLYPKFLTKTDRRNTYKLDVTQKIVKKTIKVNYRELNIILNSKYSFKMELIKLFYLILSAFKSDIENYRGTNYGILWYANNMEISSKTTSLYMSCLKELDLIYIFQDKNRKTNLIGRFKDKEFLKIWAEHNGYTGGSRSAANEARSLMMKYHQLEKGRKYSTDEVQKIKEYITWYNSKCEEGNKKDMSVFSCNMT